MFSMLWQFGWVGFGVDRGLLPGLRLGFVSVTCCRGFLQAALRRGVDRLKGKRDVD